MSWFDAPGPAKRLAVLRILVGTFATVYLLVRLPAFLALRRAPARDFEPVGVLWWMGAPLPSSVVLALLVAAVLSGAAFTAGLRFRASGPGSALTFLVLTTYHSSWGQLLWFENLAALHLLIVGLSRAADALSADARGRPDPPPSAAYGWPVRLAGLVTVLTYVLAGVAKLRTTGWSWIAGDTLRHQIAFTATRLDVLGGAPSPLAGPLLRHAWLLTAAAALTLAIELGAPLALLHPRVRDVWVGGAWMMHVAIAATMFIVFPYPLALVAFAPLYPLERLEQAGRIFRVKWLSSHGSQSP